MPHNPASLDGFALPRVGLLGNPSDGYGGRVLAFTFRDFRARVRLTAELAARNGEVRLGGSRGSFEELVGRMGSMEGGEGLLTAALHRFVLGAAAAGCDDVRRRLVRSPFALEFDTDIPAQVGMAGSSALIVATIRVLCARFGVGMPAATVARLALEAEVEDLGVSAGPQDRVVQALEGAWLMDFGTREDWRGHRYRRLDPVGWPPLYLAWSPESGQSSGVAHSNLRARDRSGDPEFAAAVRRWAELALAGADALGRGAVDELRAAMNENFDLRCTVQDVSPADRRMVELGRARGAGVKLCGSGGAVVGVPAAAGDLEALEAAYRDAGYQWLRPDLGPARPLGSTP